MQNLYFLMYNKYYLIIDWTQLKKKLGEKHSESTFLNT